MSETHGSFNFKRFGQEVEKLYNNRYRVTVRVIVPNKDEDWYYENRDNFWKGFGDLYSSELNVNGAPEGWNPADGEEYPDMKLISVEFGSLPQLPDPVMTFIYETLTDQFVEENQEKVDILDNGLRQVTRTLISDGTTSYPGQIENTTQHTYGTYGEVTLYLTSINEDGLGEEEGGFIRVQEVWQEAGVLRESKRNLSEGVVEVTKVFLAVQGATVGPITNISTSNVDGLKTISVTTMQDKDGNSIIGSGENLVHRYERKIPFTYPGVVSIRQDSIDVVRASFTDPILFNFELDPPVESKVGATVSVIFQSSGSISGSDEIYDDGSGPASKFWNPTEWAKTYVSGIGHQYRAFSDAKGLRGYRASNDVSGITEIEPEANTHNFYSGGGSAWLPGYTVNIFTFGDQLFTKAESGSNYARVYGQSDANGRKFTVDSKRLYGETPFLLEVRGGPEDPRGNKYVLDIDIRPAFDDIDGNVYYKKTIVTATV